MDSLSVRRPKFAAGGLGGWMRGPREWLPCERCTIRIPELAIKALGTPMPSPFVNRAARGNQTVLLGVGARYTFVEARRDGGEVGRMGRPDLSAELPTSSDSMRYVSAISSARNAVGIDAGAASVLSGTLARYMSTPKPFFPMLAPEIDGEGRLWVITSRSRNDSTAIDVFSRGGDYISAVMVEGRARGIATRGSRVAALIGREEEGAFDVVRIYKVSHGTPRPSSL